MHDRNLLASQIGREGEFGGQIKTISTSKNGSARVVLKDISINYSINGLESQIYVDFPENSPDDFAVDGYIEFRATPTAGFGAYAVSFWRAELISVQRARPPNPFS